MATILDFRPSGSRSGAENAGAARAPCEIVIFPGVRYERWEAASMPVSAKPRSRPRRSVKRDTLELKD